MSKFIKFLQLRACGILNEITGINPIYTLKYQFFLVYLLLIYGCFCFAAEDFLYIQTSTNKVTFNIELANTPEKRRMGLMYRTSLEPSAAMLFEYPKPKKVSIWMKNTQIPLDILFINHQGIIIKIHSNSEPFSEQSISSEQPVKAVLEFNAGLVEKFNIKVGEKVDYHLFNRN